VAYAILKTVGQGAGEISLDAIVNEACRRWRQSLSRPVDRSLLILFAILQFADIVSTNYALASPSLREGNPLMASLQAHLGTAWWLPKAAAMLLVCLMAPLLRRRWPIMFAISFYLLVVIGNLLAL
jgi:hypothetical protein